MKNHEKSRKSRKIYKNSENQAYDQENLLKCTDGSWNQLHRPEQNTPNASRAARNFSFFLRFSEFSKKREMALSLVNVH